LRDIVYRSSSGIPMRKNAGDRCPSADGLGNIVKRIIGIVLAGVCVLGTIAFFIVRSAEDEATADMLARAGRFAIPSDWKLTDESCAPSVFCA
jgi:hypothetical protein